MTGKKVFFSIKNKIVLALIVVLISVTGFNLTYSYMMFKSDKEAYIFENSLRSSELASEKILEYIQKNSEILAKDVKTKNETFYVTGEYLLPQKKFLFNYNDESYEENQKQIEAIVEKHHLKADKNVYIQPALQKLLFIIKQSNGYRFAILDNNQIIETLDKDNIFDYVVTNKQSKLYYGNKNLLIDLKSQTNLSLNQGSSIINSSNAEYLISFTQLKKLNLIIFSYISQESAFAIFKNIIYKNVAFTIIILGTFLIISLLFSKKITTPILQIISKTQEIAAGNFEGEVKVSTNDELRTLGSSVNVMSGKIMTLLDEQKEMIKQLEIANSKLDEYNKNLEGIVAERTKELREANTFITAMINSLDQGLFVFDKTKKCLDIFTQAATEMFKKVPKGLEVPKLLGLGKKEIEGFEKWSNVIFSNMMPFEAAKSLGPKNVVRSKYGKADFKFIDLEYYPMNDADDNLQNVLVVATDKTAEVESEEKFKEKDAYVSMIMKVIKNKKAFYDFLDEMNEMLENLSHFDRHEDLENVAMIVFHSMNGGFANYSISHLVKVARASETQIKSFIGNRQELEKLVKELIENWKVERDNMIAEIETQLGDSNSTIEIDKSDLKDLKKKLTNGEDPLELYEEYFVKSKVGSIFGPYADLIQQISQKINKPMTPLLVLGGDIRVDTDQIKEFSSTLVHLFRNCMDHGIESQEKRMELGKPLEGSIMINCSLKENNLHITIQDDGGGINVPKVREILEKKGIDQSKLSDKEAMMYIFQPDFSTAEKLTELSGRGVGMSAIDQSIKNMGGKLDLESEMGKGSKFIFTIPIQQ